MKKIILLLITIFSLYATQAQIAVTVNNPTNTTPNLNATYTTLAGAVTALSGITAISGPVTLTCTPGTETAPAGGYVINFIAATTAINNVVIDGQASTVTAPTPQTSGNLNDAIFKIIGSDFVTLQGFTMLENGSNTTTAAGTNNMTEFGVALFYASATNGAQNNTIQNNTITLSRLYQNSFGIYSNTNHTASSVSTTALITNATGSNSGNKVYSNTISNVNYGTVFVGSSALTAVGAQDNGNDIGGSSALTGNTYTNWGGIGVAPSGYVGLTGSNYCIFLNNNYNDNISFNNITSFSGGSTLTIALGGILKNYSTGATAQPTGTITSTINNNTITLSAAPTSGGVVGINNQGLTALGTATVNINNNTVLNSSITGGSATSGALVGITNASIPGTLNMNLNVIRNMSSAATTGQMQGITNTGAVVNAININNNQLGNAGGGFFSSSVASSGALFGISCSGGSATCATVIQNNDIRGITYNIAAASANTYIASTGTPLTSNVSSNTFTNLNINSTGTTTFISETYTAAATATKSVTGNSIVTAFSRTGASGNVLLVTDNGSSPTGCVSNVTNNNFSNITLAGTSTITGLNFTDGGTAPTRTVSGNTFNNWTAITGSINVMNFPYWNGVSSLSTNTVTNITSQSSITAVTISLAVNTATSVAISSNTINNLTSTGSGGAVTGITCSNTSTVININNNAISTLSSTGASAVNGIIISGATTTNVFKNSICDISGSNVSSTVNGISVSAGATINVYNNRIGDLRATAANASNPLVGLNITGGTTVNAYYNTVNLSATSSGSLFGSSAINASTTPALTLNNNIFANTSTANGAGLTVAYRRSSATLTTYSANSNRNDFFATTIYNDGTTSYTTIGAYITAMATRDANSFSENPPFLSTTCGNANFLKINTTTPTQLESGGAPVSGITDDFEGDVRNGTTPDVGADEFTGLPAIAMSYVSSTTTQANTSNVNSNSVNQQVIGIQIVTSGSLSPLSATSFTINTNGTTNPLTDITNLKIYYTGTNSTFGTANLFGTVAAPNGSHVIPGSQTLSSGTNYFWVTYDVLCTATVSNVIDAECNSLTVGGVVQTPTVQAPAGSRTIVSNILNGTYTVGTGGNFTTLTAAAVVVNGSGLSGNTTFSILNSIVEPGMVTLNQWAECGVGGYILTIKPAASTNPTISANSASNAVITLNGADRVTIDGSNNGTTSQNLTITNTSVTSPTGIALVSLGVGAGAINNTIKNTNINTGVSVATGYGISIGGSTPGTAGADNDNVTIQNNNITIATIPIYASGTTAVSAGGDDNLLITGNTVNSNTTIQNQGIQVGNALTSTISLNTVSVTSSGAVQPVGISLETGFLSSVVTRNNITTVLATNTGGYGGRGITVGTGNAASALTISNNTISGVNGSNWSAFSNSSSIGLGIGMIGGSGTLTTTTGGVNLYYNSVNMAGSMGTASTAALTAALYVGTGATALDIRNNVFVNTQVGTSATQKNYCVYSAVANTAFTAINYNDYFASNSFNAPSALVGFLTSDRIDIIAWRTATGQDVNSISGDPLFNSTSNLQPQTGSPLVNAGTPVSVTTDILGLNRSVTTPTIGAYEQAADVLAPIISYTVLGTTSCLTDRTLTPVTITDASGVNITAGTRPRLYYKKSGNANTVGATNTNTTDGWKFVEATGAGGSPFSFTTNYSLLFGPAPTTTDVIQYFVVAQDLAGTPNVGINSGTFTGTPSSVALTAAAFPIGGTINSYTISPVGISGIVNVGAAQTFKSLTEVGTATGIFANINANGLSGNTTVVLMDAGITETGVTALNAIASSGCSGGPFTLIIKPNTATTTTLTGSVAAGAIIKLNGADNVTIDGSNNGSTTKDLTITNTNAATSGNAVIWMASASASDGATNNTVKNTIITGNAATTTQMGIFSGSTAAISTSGNALTPNFGNTYQNNTVSKSQYGIFVIGVGTSTLGTGLTITGNTLGTSTAGDGFQIEGIDIQFQNGAVVTGNDVQNIASATTFSNMQGINVVDSKSSTISANKIHFMNYSGASSTKVYGISTSTTTFNVVGNPSANGYYNNVIYDLISTATSASWNISGINNNGGYADKYYYNSVYLTGQMSASTGGSAAFSNGNGLTSTSSPVIDMQNNAFYMKGSSTAAAPLYAHYTTVTTYSGSTINNNDLISTASGSGVTQLGRFNSTNYLTLAAWQAATSKDANSISADPLFFSNTNLQPTSGSPLLNAGTPVSVLTDILGQGRSGTTPTIGSYETTIGVVAVGVEYFRGSKLGTANYLDWKVNCSSDPSVRLILERSADSRTFTAIQDQNVTAARCSQGFSYTDAAPLAGINYYRLKTISPDGSFRYSMIVALINKDKGFELISVAPNPVRTNTVLSISSVKAGRMSIAVSDMTGKVVMTQNITVIAGNNPINMNFASLSAGTYNIKVINADNEVKTTRFVKY